MSTASERFIGCLDVVHALLTLIMSFVFGDVFLCFVVFFFFQAEDGIRDWSVTGVQTCALPIWANLACRSFARDINCLYFIAEGAGRDSEHKGAWPLPNRPCYERLTAVGVQFGRKIGRASCRERV